MPEPTTTDATTAQATGQPVDAEALAALVDLGVCHQPVDRAVMVHWWDELTFLHWRYPVEEVQRLLPPGLEVHAIDGSAWVGLVPFFIKVALPHTRSKPWLSEFPETNVRTYVRDADGNTGIWFFSLDAARLGAVLVARTTYRLPYLWAKMRVSHVGATVTYQCRRRWPGPRGARCNAVIEVGEPFAPHELGELDHFLTARWALYSAPATGLHRALAFHDPWPLHRAKVVHLEDDLVVAAGLSPPQGEPLVHFAPSVEVRVGLPHPVDPAHSILRRWRRR